MQMVDYGIKIIKRREEFIGQVNEFIGEIHGKLSGGREKLVIKYEPDISVDEFSEKLRITRERDIKTKTTNIGPHRDDLGFFIDGMDIRKYGSQGQQRTAALSLKLSEIELVKKMINDNPVLLLDDVMSELDSNRQNQLIESIKGIQTIITCTGLDEFIENRLNIHKIYKITKGTAESL